MRKTIRWPMVRLWLVARRKDLMVLEMYSVLLGRATVGMQVRRGGGEGGGGSCGGRMDEAMRISSVGEEDVERAGGGGVEGWGGWAL